MEPTKNIQETLRNELKEAMKAKDQTRLNVTRGLLSAFTNELVAKGRTPQDKLNDEESLAVIRREAKKRKDSIEQFKAGGREELALAEEKELTILEAYLPKMMSEDEITEVVKAKQAELGITDKSKAGLLMAGVMKELQGKADGKIVKEIVEKLLS